MAMRDAAWSCPDLPGHGTASDLPCRPGQVIEFIEQHAAAMDLKEKDSRKILLGYSMGGRAALLHACQFPEKWSALVLISANPGIESEAERKARCEADKDLADSVTKGGVTAFVEQWQEQPMIRSQKNIAADWYAAMQHTRQQHQAHGLAANLAEFGQGNCPNLWPQLETLNMPILLISGLEDEKYTAIASRMHAIIPNSKHVPITGAGHMPHLEQPKQTAEALRVFIRDL